MKSRWEQYLDTLNDDQRAEALRAFEEATDGMKEVMRRYPPGTYILTPDFPLYIIHYFIGPDDNYLICSDSTPQEARAPGAVWERYAISATEMNHLEKELIAHQRVN